MRTRKRATCGTDTRREDPCSTNVHEVIVRRGRVSAINAEPGDGDIARDTVVLVGREGGADELRQLQIGDPVFVGYYLASTEHVPFWFAVGGQPIVRDGAAAAGLEQHHRRDAQRRRRAAPMGAACIWCRSIATRRA